MLPKQRGYEADKFKRVLQMRSRRAAALRLPLKSTLPSFNP